MKYPTVAHLNKLLFRHISRKLNYIITNSARKSCHHLLALLENLFQAVKMYRARLSSRIKSALQNKVCDLL